MKHMRQLIHLKLAVGSFFLYNRSNNVCTAPFVQNKYKMAEIMETFTVTRKSV